MRLLLVLLVVAAAAADYAMEGKEYSLQCTGEGPVQYWMLHGAGTAYLPGKTYEEDSLRVDSDGTLHFTEVVISHEGDHLCVFSHSQLGTSGARVSMQVRPKPSEDLWNDVYMSQFVTGLLAAVVCALLFTAGCLVFRFRYREPKAELLKGEEGGHYNPALDVEGDATRM